MMKGLKMKLQSIMYVVVLLTAVSILPAANVELADISGEAVWFSHFDVEQFNSSQLKGLAAEYGLTEKSDKIRRYLGFDPMDTIQSITVYGTSANPEDAAVVLKGDFDSRKLLKIVQKHTDHSVSEYNGSSIYTWKSFKGADKSGCFYNGTTLLMARDADMIKTAIDTLAGVKPSLTENCCMVSDSAIFQMYVQDASKLADRDPKLVFLNNISGSLFALGQKGSEFFCELIMQADSKENAELLGQMVNGMVAMGKINAAERSDRLLKDALDKVYVSTEDAIILTTMVMDAEQLSEMIRKFADQTGVVSAVRNKIAEEF